MEALAGGGFGESEEMRGSTRLHDGQFSPALALLGVWNGAQNLARFGTWIRNAAKLGTCWRPGFYLNF